MTSQHPRQKFMHAAPPRLSRGVVVSAAFLAMAATGGILLSQTPGQAQPQRASAITGADMVRDAAGRASRSEDRMADAPPQAPAPQAPAAQAAAAQAAVAPVAVAPAQAPVVPTQAPAAPPAPATPVQAPAAPAAPPSSKVLNYTFQLQPNYYYCGPASTRIVLSTTGRILSQDEIARGLHTTTGGTDSAEDATRMLNSVVDGKPYQTRAVPNMSAAVAQAGQVRADIVQAIGRGHGVVANIVHSATDTNGVSHAYDGGHYVAIVGYKDDGRTVKVADPANPNGDGTYWVDSTVMAKWMATHGYSY